MTHLGRGADGPPSMLEQATISTRLRRPPAT